MFRKGYLVFCLLVASLMTTTTLHAREMPGVPSVECSGAIHVEEQDGTSSTGDADKALVHHHGCHAGSSFIASSPDGGSDLRVVSPLYTKACATTLLCRQSGPDLRPPIA